MCGIQPEADDIAKAQQQPQQYHVDVSAFVQESWD